jgi:SAM-dependent methyltransferase
MSAADAVKAPWWQSFFDADYIRVWGEFKAEGRTASEVQALWDLLQLRPGSRLLDAPCGYGRVSRPLAQRGAVVLGVDYSAHMLAHAEQDRGHIPVSQLRYLQHDLRFPLPEAGFDAACNLFTSLGYGTEEDDLAILRTLCGGVRPGGLVFIDTSHRDTVVSMLARGIRPSNRLSDGTLVVEEMEFDPVSGRSHNTWYWSGPAGAGEKAASLRIYTITELVKLVEAAGLRFCALHPGCSAEPYKAAGPDMGGRAGILARREN